MGDPRPYAASARRADGSEVDVSLAWSITPGNAATITPQGIAVASSPGPITVRAVAGGVAGTRAATGYDWESLASEASALLRLGTDTTVTNRFGTAGLPELIVGCAGGTFFVAVLAAHVHLAHGTVTYAFDDQQPVTETWFAVGESGGLLYHGTSNASHKALAAKVAASDAFTIRLTELAGGERVAHFRVTGLAGRLGPLLAGCPSQL